MNLSHSEPVIVFSNGEAAEVSASAWAREVLGGPARMSERLEFMSEAHHAVRLSAVRELLETGRPVTPQVIAARTALDRVRISEVLAELEERLFFLVRNHDGDVTWAFPVTVDRTPHRLTFSTGERLYGA
ncbi:MAG: hypothetical protein BMS9Abin29_1609 [Gemmatimonadota bacterium]|nr:MAG: hypothetical protein BMS9Abin29_1609 [Gemmatimonadota bacterium]